MKNTIFLSTSLACAMMSGSLFAANNYYAISYSQMSSYIDAVVAQYLQTNQHYPADVIEQARKEALLAMTDRYSADKVPRATAPRVGDAAFLCPRSGGMFGRVSYTQNDYAKEVQKLFKEAVARKMALKKQSGSFAHYGDYAGEGEVSSEDAFGHILEQERKDIIAQAIMIWRRMERETVVPADLGLRGKSGDAMLVTEVMRKDIAAKMRDNLLANFSKQYKRETER